MAYRTVVVGTDGSATAGVARDAAVRLAKRCRARLLVVSSYEPPRLSRENAQQILEQAVNSAQRARVQAEGVLERGEPAERIAEVALRERADVVVVGNLGMGAARRVRLGSVADRVAHEAPCDLLIVDTTRRGGKRRDRPYGAILAGTDGSATATAAASRAFELAALFGGSVTLVYVGDPLIGAIKLEEAAAGRPDEVEVETVVEQGDPAEKICGIAAGWADLVVVGNKGMAGVRRLLGSVPNKVAHEAPADVLIVKTVDRKVADLAPGHGGLVNVDGRTLAVYRDEDGGTVMLAPRCPHLGCTVDWNDADRTWDCPCHGSRFAVDGSVVRGPADRPLEPVETGERGRGGGR